jgi:hypothetical protein
VVQQLTLRPAAPHHVTFGPATTVNNSNITIPQQGHQLDSDDPFVTSNNSDAVAGIFRPSLPITQVWDFITLNLILNYLFI